MKIQAVELYAYQIPLDPPLCIQKKIITNRDGFIIRLTSKEGFSGIGEIAPLPGFQQDSPADFIKQFPEIRNWLLSKDFFPEITRLNGILSKDLESLNLMPSVQFGLESALLQLSASANKKPIYKELSESITRNLMLAGLVHADKPDVFRKVTALYNRGFRTIKIKVGVQDINDDIRCIRELHKLTEKKIKFRIDANRSWQIEEAVFFANEIKYCYPDFIEEPINDPRLLIEFVYITQMPVGLDESLSFFYPDIYWAKALVIKPAVIGNLDTVNQYIKFANQTRKLAIISDTYLTAVGLTMEMALAAALIKNPAAMGFGTYGAMREDVVPLRIIGENNTVNVLKAVSALNTLNFNNLQKMTC